MESFVQKNTPYELLDNYGMTFWISNSQMLHFRWLAWPGEAGWLALSCALYRRKGKVGVEIELCRASVGWVWYVPATEGCHACHAGMNVLFMA